MEQEMNVGEKKWQWACFLSRLILGLLFLGSGFLKASRPAQEFSAGVEIYQVLPHSMLPLFSLIFPWVELLLGLSLLGGAFTKIASRGARLLSALFIAVILSALLRGIPVESCGCFGEGLALSPWNAIGLDIGLFLLTFLSVKGDRFLSLDQWINKGS